VHNRRRIYLASLAVASVAILTLGVYSAWAKVRKARWSASTATPWWRPMILLE